MKDTDRVRINLIVDAAHPALLQALQATEGIRRAERMRCLAAMGLAAERGQFVSAVPAGHAAAVGNGAAPDEAPPGRGLDELAWDADLVNDGAA